MLRTLLLSKLHAPTVTAIEPDYEGSIAVDTALLEAAGMRLFEQVHVYNRTNGERFITYLIPAPAHSGCVSVNGAAARKVLPGDVVILATYAQAGPEELQDWRPQVVLVDAQNRIKPGPSNSPPLPFDRV